MNHLPKLIRPSSAKKTADHAIHFSSILTEVAQLEKSAVFSRMRTAPEGLSTDEAARRWAEVWPNVVAAGKHRGWPWRLLSATRNPLVILLVVLAAISFATGDAPAGFVMVVMVFLGVLLRFVQEARADALFQTGWFVESLITQTLIVHVIRTNKMPFIHGRASWQLTLTTAAIMAVAAWLPYSPVTPALGFTALPPLYWPILLATLLCYVVLTQFVKMWLIRKTWL